MRELPFAEDVNYWQTSRSSPDTWTAKTIRQIEKLGGHVMMEGFGSEPMTGRAAFMLGFELDGDQFKVVWSVLPTRGGNDRAARIQAATMLYHDIKAKCISAAVRGSRAAFFSFLLLSDGKAVSEMAIPDLLQAVPELLATALMPGDILESDVLEAEFEEIEQEA